MERQRIERLNFLSQKAKSSELSVEEIAERDFLRKEYIKSYRESLENKLDNTWIIGRDGIKRKLKKKE